MKLWLNIRIPDGQKKRSMKKVKLSALGSLVDKNIEIQQQRIVATFKAKDWYRVAETNNSLGAIGLLSVMAHDTLNTAMILRFIIGHSGPISFKNLDEVRTVDRIIGARVLTKTGSKSLIDIRQNTEARMVHSIVLSNNNNVKLVDPFISEIPTGYTATEFMF